MSSINLHQTQGLKGAFSTANCSNFPTNRLAYEGAIRVPVAVDLKKVLVVEIEVVNR